MRVVFFLLTLSMSDVSYSMGPGNIQSVAAHRLKVQSDQLLQKVELQSLDQSPDQFCNDTLAARFLRSKVPRELSQAEFEKAVRSDTLSELAEKVSLRAPTTPWEDSLVPSERIRAGLTDQIPFRGILPRSRNANDFERPDQLNYLDLESAVRMLNLDRCAQPSSLRDQSSLPPKQVYKTPTGVTSKDLAKSYACAELLGLAKRSNCDQSFETLERIATPTQAGATGVELFSKVLEDPRYDRGLKIAALKLAKRTKQKSLKGQNYFEDVKESFTDAGATPAEAEEMAWNTIALIATSGPNLYVRMAMYPDDGTQGQSRLALNTIAMSLPVLDHRSAAEGRLYSYPRGIEGSCNTGKSYHFWFAAYLARQATLESGDPSASAVATFQAQKFYQIRQRDSARAMSKSRRFSSASEIVRADLAYSAAGAHFGSRSAVREASKINVDQGLRTLVEKAGLGDLGLLGGLAGTFGGEAAATYVDWNKKFNANAVFTDMRDQLSDLKSDAYLPTVLNQNVRPPQRSRCPVDTPAGEGGRD